MKAAVAITVVAFAATLSVAAQPPQPTPMNSIAERYVKLVLAVGQHDADYVDAFYGPPEWKAEAERRKLPLAEIDAAARAVDRRHSARCRTPTAATSWSCCGTTIWGGSSRRCARACGCCRARS